MATKIGPTGTSSTRPPDQTEVLVTRDDDPSYVPHRTTSRPQVTHIEDGESMTRAAQPSVAAPAIAPKATLAPPKTGGALGARPASRLDARIDTLCTRLSRAIEQSNEDEVKKTVEAMAALTSEAKPGDVSASRSDRLSQSLSEAAQWGEKTDRWQWYEYLLFFIFGPIDLLTTSDAERVESLALAGRARVGRPLAEGLLDTAGKKTGADDRRAVLEELERVPPFMLRTLAAHNTRVVASRDDVTAALPVTIENGQIRGWFDNMQPPEEVKMKTASADTSISEDITTPIGPNETRSFYGGTFAPRAGSGDHVDAIDTNRLGGIWASKANVAVVVTKAGDFGGVHTKDVGVTSHEVWHAYDSFARVSDMPAFRAAVDADRGHIAREDAPDFYLHVFADAGVLFDHAPLRMRERWPHVYAFIREYCANKAAEEQ